MDDVRRENYSSDFSYQLARQNTWEFPRFCFGMFRPRVEDWAALYQAVEQYQGEVAWVMHDGCIAAMPAKLFAGYSSFSGSSSPGWTFYPPITSEVEIKNLEEAIRNPPKPDPVLVKKAIADIPTFCGYLEQRLGLQEKASLDFDPQWLTREGLAQSRGEFEEFFEPGSWSVFLARDPKVYPKMSKPTSPADRSLRMGIEMSEHDALFKELGARWETGGERQPVLKDYPLLSRLDEITSDATYAPEEVSSLLTEYSRAEQVVKDPESIRGLDKLIRIAKWAQKLQLGIYFGGQ